MQYTYVSSLSLLSNADEQLAAIMHYHDCAPDIFIPDSVLLFNNRTISEVGGSPAKQTSKKMPASQEPSDPPQTKKKKVQDASHTPLLSHENATFLVRDLGLC